MLRRLGAFVAAVLLVATPVATVVCEANCADDAQTPAAGGQHACCPERSSGDGAAIVSIATPCDHVANVAATTPQPQLFAAAPPAVASASPAWPTGAPTRTGRTLPPTPDSFPPTTPLRI